MKNQIKKILVISLTNIGDIILTFPVIDILKRDFPAARLDVIIGAKGESLVKDNPHLGKVYVYRKNQPLLAMIKWMRELASEKYDLVVDLRNSAIPFLIFPKYRTPLMFIRPKVGHMRQQHLARLATAHDFKLESTQKFSLRLSSVDVPAGAYVVMAPGSRAENKRWSPEGFAQLGDYLAQRFGMNIVLVGDENDQLISETIFRMMKHKPLDMTGKLTLPQVGFLLAHSHLAVVNDSAPLHLASYLNVPVAAFFGPTDPRKYGPWGDKKIVIQKNNGCPACAGDKASRHDCTKAIEFSDALAVLEPWLAETLRGK